MIARLIAWSARNLLLVLFGAGFAAAAGIYARPPAARRHPRPLGYAGDRLHRISRVRRRRCRGPGHLSADDGDADRAEIEGGARLLLLRRLLRLRHLRGRHRHLLGALAACSNISTPRRAPAGRRDADLGPDATGVGWVYQYAVIAKELNLADTALAPGLEPALRAGQGRGRRRSRQRRRLRQAIQRRR
jgi:Cu(I)/Ag(I) efflux system membrane protein CusA/SilA